MGGFLWTNWEEETNEVKMVICGVTLYPGWKRVAFWHPSRS